MDSKEAWKVVDSVFDKCYNDLEPIGRRVRRNSYDRERAYRERYFYGYE
jgi:inner membrane protease ATP23